MRNIVDVLVDDKNLATLSKSLKAAGLENEFCRQGPFTLFAPTDVAFGKLPKGELPELLKPENKVKLAEILNYHLVSGKKYFSDFKDGQKLKTINGKELEVKVANGEVTINGSRVQGKDNESSNGIIHSIDRIIATN